MRLRALASMLSAQRRGVESLHSYADVRRVAKRRLPRMVFDFVEGGADGEVTTAANVSAFDGVHFAPRYLADVSDRRVETTVLGAPVSLPFLLAPAGLATVVHRDGELAAARAAAAAGTVFCVSTASGYTLEEIADVGPGRRWFQLYLWKSSDLVKSLVGRARDAGYEALILTVDVPVVGKRERDMRNGMSLPPRIRPANAIDTAWRWPWVWHLLTGPEITFASLVDVVEGDDASAIGEYVSRDLTDPARTWDDLAWLRREWDGPLLVKGVMTAADAKAAVDRGADGVIVSNHGGRQLDGVPGALDVLPEIVDAVDGRGEVLLDGGVRRGADVVKAKALGASAAMGGRAWFFALAAGGEAGVRRMIEIIRADVDRTLALVGVPRYEEVDGSALRR